MVQVQVSADTVTGKLRPKSLESRIAAGGAAKQRAYTEPGVVEGWDTRVDLDYATDDPQQPESFMWRVRSVANVLTKTFWLNESGLPRAWAVRKQEPALKLHAYADDNVAPVLEVRGPWNQTAIRRWGVNSKGAQLLGPNQVVAGAVVTLATGAPLPTGLPDGTLIVRTA